jgi:hypothetical protein
MFEVLEICSQIYYIKIELLNQTISQKYPNSEDSTSTLISCSTVKVCCVVAILIKFNQFIIETYPVHLATKMAIISTQF